MSELVSSTLHTPEDVLEVARLHHVESLSKSGDLLGVAMLTCLAQVMLIVGDELLDFLPGVPSVDAVFVGTAARKRHESVDEHLAAVVRLGAAREQLPSSLDQIRTDALEESLVLLLAEALHDVAEL